MIQIGETLSNGETVLWTGDAEPVRTSPLGRFCRRFAMEAMWWQYGLVRKTAFPVLVFVMALTLPIALVVIFLQTGTLAFVVFPILIAGGLWACFVVFLTWRIARFSARAPHRYVVSNSHLYVLNKDDNKILESLPHADLRRRVILAHGHGIGDGPVTLFYRERLGVLISIAHMLDFDGLAVWNVSDMAGLMTVLDRVAPDHGYQWQPILEGHSDPTRRRD